MSATTLPGSVEKVGGHSEASSTARRPLVPAPKGPRATDESTDTYDTIDWLLKNIPNNNGRVGQWGISYPGSQTVWGMIDAHPALKASSPQAPAIDMFLGDDFHHNGAFRLMYTFSWLAGNARPRAGTTETRGAAFDYGTPDGYRFFLDVGPISMSVIIFVVGLQVWLFRSRWGLRTRAVGEHPRAADTVGIDVIRLRYRNVILGGVFAGLAGAWLTLEATRPPDGLSTSRSKPFARTRATRTRPSCAIAPRRGR